jgi:esterase/lipase superfamily enzyme
MEEPTPEPRYGPEGDGHWGKPIIVFPCSRGRYFDCEGLGMIEATAGFINAGKIKLFCVDSVDEESWYNFAVSPSDRNARHEAYDRYIVEEVIPFIRDHWRERGRAKLNA